MRKLTSLILPLLLTLVLIPHVCRAQTADFDAATQAYQQRNYAAALPLFTELATAGDARAQAILGLMYRFGEGTAADAAQAFQWYHRAAETGYAPAQYQLAELYAQGIGTPEDPSKALKWLEAASANGFTRATAQLQRQRPAQPASPPDTGPGKNDWNLNLPTQSPQSVVELGPPASRYRVQLGSFTQRTSAISAWQSLVATDASLFEAMQPYLETTLDGSNSPDPIPVYQIQAGPLANFEAAVSLCRAIRQRQPDSPCLVVTEPRPASTASKPGLQL